MIDFGRIERSRRGIAGKPCGCCEAKWCYRTPHLLAHQLPAQQLVPRVRAYRPPRLSEPHLRRAFGFDRASGSHRQALRLGTVRARGSRAATAGFGGTRAWRTYSGCKRNLDSPNAASGSQTVPDNNVRLSQTRPGITGTRIGAVAQPTPKLRRRAGMSLTKQSVVSSARELSAT